METQKTLLLTLLLIGCRTAVPETPKEVLNGTSFPLSQAPISTTDLPPKGNGALRRSGTLDQKWVQRLATPWSMERPLSFLQKGKNCLWAVACTRL